MGMSDAAPFDPTAPERPPRLAATLVVVRDGAEGMEVLLLCRAERGDHNSGAWVFPGGMVDRGDASVHSYCAGLTDAQASERLAVPDHGLDYYVAALRECFEECGLLFARESGGGSLGEERATLLQPWRMPLHRGEKTLDAMCEAENLVLSVNELAYLSHWLTPLGRAKRFDTRFFVAVAPPGQTALQDGVEMVGLSWLRPQEALECSDSLKLMGPTRATLNSIARFSDTRGLMAWAREARDVSLIHPRIGHGKQGMRPVMPHEPAWAEMGRVDPLGHGTARYDMAPGAGVHLSAHVIRVTARNPGVMTGPGTNTYLVGDPERNEWAVIDPGPALPDHVEAILAAAPGKISWILATHTHLDHSPAAALLQQHTHAQLLGRVAQHAERQDAGFVPDRVLEDGERLALSDLVTLRVLHTPGHASNHLCYLFEQERLLFTGDHLMQASTVVINPPDGDMSAYLQSLQRLQTEAIDWLAPGHGFLMAQPGRAIQSVIDHRLKREAKVVAVLREHGPGAIDALLPRVYDDVDPRMLPVAQRSLLAHLLKLRVDGVAREADERWSLR